jgi:hypothetical protein
VQEVEEVREAHKAAASAQMAGIAEMAQSAELVPRIEKTRWHQKRREAPKKTVLAPRFEPETMLT